MQKLYHKKYGVLTAKEKRYSPVGNTIITIWVDSKGIERELDGTEITLEEYEQQQRFLKEQEERTKKNQSFDENVREVFSHMKLVKGAKGDPGKDGYTPKAGVDYYTKKQIEVLIESIQDKALKGTIQSLIEDIKPIKGKDYFDGKEGYTPQYGKDYFTKEDIQMFFSEITKKVQSKVRNGIDGKDGKKGKGVEFKWEGTKLYIKKEGEEWGEGKDLKGLDGLSGGGGIHKIQDATDVSYENPTQGQALVWDTTSKKWIPGSSGSLDGDIDVKNYDILNVSKQTFNTLYTVTGSEPTGTINWNTVDGTFNMVLNSGVTLQAGQELYFYGKASGDIANGDLCMFAGVQGDHILISKATTAVITNPQYLIGVATTSFLNGTFGYVTWFGKINNIYTKTPLNNDDADWTAGDILYFSNTTGQLTKTVPNAPEIGIQVAAVIKEQTGSSENGIIIVRPTFGLKLENLDDVDGADPTTTGDLLSFNATSGVWERGVYNIEDYLKSGDIVTSDINATTLVTESDTIAGNDNDTTIPTSAAVKDYADSILGTANALVYKGVIDCSTNPNYPASDAGFLYVVSVAGKIGGASGVEVEVGDMVICNTDGTASGTQASVGTKWNVIQKNIIGAVTGPATSTDNGIPIFDGTTGKIIKDAGKTIITESQGIASNDNDTTIPTSAAVKDYVDDNIGGGAINILANGNFINNSTNGYGGTSDDWTNSSANPVQGGIPAFTKQNLIDWLGISDGDIEGLWNLNEASGNATDLSSNGYTLTDNNTVGSSDDGLMAKARDFEAGNSEYLSIAGASSGNLNITGSQTFFAFVKIESFSGGSCCISLGSATGGQEKRLFILDTGSILFQLHGLTTNSTVSSDVKMETGKWYFILGRYNGSTLDVFINKIKKSATASGSVTSITADRVIGASETKTIDFFDGLIQNAGVLSVALTDAQVERLWWETLGKKTKLRRATSDGYIYQSLPQNLVEQYKGKTLSVTAKVYQDTASIAQVSLYDGAETASSTSSTTGSWINIGATRTISGTARQIDIRAKVSSSDGNAWFKEIQVYEGSSLVYEWNPENPAKNEIGGVKSTINISPLYAPEGFLLNGKIVPSVTSNNLTVALKTLSGGDPSASDPIYVRIGDTVRSITSALSVTKNAGTNWCNAGSSELATKEIDYFVYLGYNATDGVVIGFSRIPYGALYSDFSATTTNEKYCAISTITNATASDVYTNIGRFAATLSAGAGYTWSVPTFTTANLIQRPIDYSKTLQLAQTFTWSGGTTDPGTASSNLCHYSISGRRVNVDGWWDSGSTTAGANRTGASIKSPFTEDTSVGVRGPIVGTNLLTTITTGISGRYVSPNYLIAELSMAGGTNYEIYYHFSFQI